MRQKHLLWLVGTLGILVVIAYFSGAFSTDFAEMDVPNFSISEDEIEQIVITSGNSGEDITLVKQDNRWALTAPLQTSADSIAMTRLISNLGSLEIESVVSMSPERYENYGVTDSAQKITATVDGVEQTLFIGETGPDYMSMYVRVNDDPRVFVTNGRVNAPQDLSAWRDKTIMKLPSSNIERIDVTSPVERYSIERAGGSWQILFEGQTATADSAGVVRWLDRFATLKASGFSSANTRENIAENTTHSITFSLYGGASYTFWLLDQESTLIGATSDSENVYTLSKGMLANYVPESRTLRQTP